MNGSKTMRTRRNALALGIALLATACAGPAPITPPTPHATVMPIIEDFGARRYYRIQFEPGSATLTAESLRKVRRAIYMLARIHMQSFELWGHGDPGEARRAANRLALRRMKVVAQVIMGDIGPPKPVLVAANRRLPRGTDAQTVLIRVHGTTERTPPDGLEDDRSPVESSVEIYCSEGELPWDSGTKTKPTGQERAGVAP